MQIKILKWLTELLNQAFFDAGLDVVTLDVAIIKKQEKDYWRVRVARAGGITNPFFETELPLGIFLDCQQLGEAMLMEGLTIASKAIMHDVLIHMFHSYDLVLAHKDTTERIVKILERKIKSWGISSILEWQIYADNNKITISLRRGDRIRVEDYLWNEDSVRRLFVDGIFCEEKFQKDIADATLCVMRQVIRFVNDK